MSPLQALILGIVQGITEFLPVSSFGHLAVLEGFFSTERSTAVLFEALLHLGTLAALFAAMWGDIRRVAEELLGMATDLIGNANIYLHNRRTGENLPYARIITGTYRRFAALVAVSAIPTAMLGFACRGLVTKAAISPLLPGALLLVNGIFLLVTDFSRVGGTKTPKNAGFDSAMWMGIGQGISVFPGLSRCGLTVCAGLLCGLSRKFAVRFSYIMSIPAILGAFLMEVPQFVSPGMTVGLGFTYLLGALAAAVTGYFAVRFCLHLLQKVQLRWFAFYCFFAGAVALIGNFL